MPCWPDFERRVAAKRPLRHVRSSAAQAGGLDGIVKLWREYEPAAHGPEYLFFDEIQFTRDWQTWLKHQVDFVADGQGRLVPFGSEPVTLLPCGTDTNSFLGLGAPRATVHGYGVAFENTLGGRHGVHDVGAALKRFGYLRDRLFLGAVAGYALNRWLLKPLLPSPFLHGYFADLLLTPAALPVVLWMQRLLGLRQHDLAPSWMEMGLHLVVWSAICELIGPLWLHRGTADVWDVVAYAVGGVAACAWWNRPVQPIPHRTP